MKVQCKDCKQEFTLTDGEVNFFKLKNLAIPKRCKTCRRNRKLLNSTVEDLKHVSRNLSINDSNSVELLKRALG